jgi:adenine-specific DNA-methyltransferase
MEFMLPRLVASKEIMNDSAVIAISIDDYEYAYLKVLMDSVFGEECFVGSIIVCRSRNGKGGRKNIASNHEYLLVYGRTTAASVRGLPDTTEYDRLDEYGSYRLDGLFRKKGEGSLREDRPNMYYPLYCDPVTGSVSLEPEGGLVEVYPKDSKGVDRRWLWGRETAETRVHQLYASKNGVVYVKNYSHSAEGDNVKRIKSRSIWAKPEFYTERATNELKAIFGEKIFDTPKAIGYIETIVDMCSEPGDLVLDFFAGAGTTAHAVDNLNEASTLKRKCILMENDTIIPEKHCARSYGYKRVADITEARLKMISERNENYAFCVTKLPSSYCET